MRSCRSSPFVAAAFLSAVLLCVHASLAARVLLHCDLDSLDSLAESIVRAQLVSSESIQTGDWPTTVHTVKVLDVLKGSITSGASLRLLGLGYYRCGLNMGHRRPEWDPIGIGDMVYLFLEPKQDDWTTPLTHADRTVVESGVRLVIGNDVYAFGQLEPTPFGVGFNAPYGFIAMSPATFPGVAVQTRDQFEAELRQCPAEIAAVEQLIARPASEATATAIVASLRQRREVLRQQKATDDKLAERLAVRLSEIAPPAQVVAAMDGEDWRTRQTLENGLCSRAAGRDYVLDRVADAKLPLQQQDEWFEILSGSGWPYVQDLLRGGDTTVRPDFVTRLAALASKNMENARGDRLREQIGECASANHAPGTPLAADLDGAARVLMRGFAQCAALNQFKIAETVMQISDQRYRELLPHAGPMLTLIEQSGPVVRSGGQRTLSFQCRFRNCLDRPSTLKLVLEPEDGQPEVLVDANTDVGNLVSSFGSMFMMMVQLPPNLSGEFHAFLRDYLDGHPQGDGIGFELKLPAG